METTRKASGPPPTGVAPDVPLRYSISPGAVGWLLTAIITVLLLLSVAEQYVIHIQGREDLEEFLIAVDVDAEGNIPTWYSSMTLLAAAAVLAVIASRARRRAEPLVGHWAFLSATFVLLSIDETAQLHEHLGRLQSIWDTHGFLYFAWVIPGAIAVAVLAVAYIPLLRRLPPATRRRYLAAAVVYVGGALGMEAIGARRAETMGMNNMTHSLIATAEEGMEMAGVAMFIVASLQHLAGARAVVDVEAEEPPREAAP